MRSLRRRTNFSKIAYSPITLVILLLVLIVVARGLWGAYNKQNESRQGLEQVLNEQDEVLSAEDKLRAEIAKLGTLEGKEDAIREKFRLGKDGEKIVILVEENETNDGEIRDEHESFWSRLRSLLPI